MKEVRLKIDGMNCINCANKIKNECLKNGVIQANINVISKDAIFMVDDDFSLEKLEFIIKNLGFSILDKNIKNKKNYKLEKMLVALFASIFCYFNNDFLLTSIACSFAVFFSASSFFYKAFFKKSFGMDLLVSLGVGINYIYSFFSISHTYFFESSFTIFIVSFGKFIEEFAKNKANKNLNYKDEAFILLKNNTKIKAQDVKIGDEIIIKAQEEIKIDGILESKIAYLDESVLSGESKIIVKKQGDKLYQGSINLNEQIIIKASSNYYDSSLQKLKDEAQKAMNQKIKLLNLTDKIASKFVLIISVIAAFCFSIWYYLSDLNTAFFYTSSVFLISCPCALGLCVPMVVAISVNICFKNKIILKNPEILSEFYNINTFAFDKTGTLTSNIQSIKHNLSDDDFKIIASVESLINHPIAKSIANSCTNLMQIDGQIELKDNILSFKNKDYDVKIIPSENELTCFINDKEVGKIFLENKLSKDAKELISFLKKQNKRIIILSGDSKTRVEQCAKELNINEFYYRLSAEQKAQIIKELNEKVLYVGDGANDILSIVNADFSVSFNEASAVAKSKSDVILIEKNLENIKNIFSLFKKSNRKIKENLIFSFFYNFFGLILASGLLSSFSLHLNPALCAFLMSMSSLIVVANSLLLFKHKF
ncbi:heavy metal translocating P-type ATPase [Campylobacter canadensis]|uniref:Copper-transporting ATPase n=1 Tax=Campylobacter canadensis TaxID=449520 RepID=A0ABS7WSG3_9BACT|nr:cation-translocating P-type ATPase [Campylobacter canadensis]MBZ7987704.1 cation-translocating P-type ATPase [Campylobacter canadensis]MBZ7994111.1 cation-translocating P-type ATPase [Campylobacter canadensis]MBZ7995886.1 cation-translocating P-type ATPase [Campylobacter canadensis]MBZ7997523.1 cation-translocating P-type ATPase [Campylobacter canadensis]MBZ7999442.1 cation-translocating P-type ATPase [Campylobacter canadensis]